MAVQARIRNRRCELRVSPWASPCLVAGAAVSLPGTAWIVLPASGFLSVWYRGPGGGCGVLIGRCLAASADVPSRKNPMYATFSPMCAPFCTVRARVRASGARDPGKSGHLSWASQHPRWGPAHDLLSGLPTCCLPRRPLPGPAPGSGYLGSQPAHSEGLMCHLPAQG